MKKITLALFTLTLLAQAYPELCMPDHQDDYVNAYREAKTSIDNFWQSSGQKCDEVGGFLDFFEQQDPPASTATEKEKCIWAGSIQGVALFSHQREEQCGIKKCTRVGGYIGRKVAKSFCGLVELYTSDLAGKFISDLERPVCIVNKDECVNEAEIYAGTKCPALKTKYSGTWSTILKQTCY